jgi:hypothetical protein
MAKVTAFLFFLTVPVLIIGFISSCNPTVEVVSVESEEISILGSWDLSSYIDHGAGESNWKSYNPDITYQKHITPTHFVWIHYNKSEDKLYGAGGGSYKFDGQIYTENIQYFYPPGSSIPGQKIPFDVSLENGVWHHTGYSKELTFDPVAIEVKVIDTIKIEERWDKIRDGSVDKDLQRTWRLVGYYASESDTALMQYPDLVNYIKLITPTHFAWIRYYTEKEGAEIIGLGAGRWELGEVYTEHIEAMYPSGSGQVNSSINFSIDLSNGNWNHFGYIHRMGQTENGEFYVIDTSLVHEVWKPFMEE